MVKKHKRLCLLLLPTLFSRSSVSTVGVTIDFSISLTNNHSLLCPNTLHSCAINCLQFPKGFENSQCGDLLITSPAVTMYCSMDVNFQRERILVSSKCLKRAAWPKTARVAFFSIYKRNNKNETRKQKSLIQTLTWATSSKSSCLFCSARALCRDFPTPVCLLRKASPWFSIQSSTCQKRRTSNYLSCQGSTEKFSGRG